MNMLENLSEPQKEAVTHIEGPLLVIAGAGSGKTRVITHRIAYLVSRGISPWNILAITFTNKAAEEMLTRTQSMVDIGHLWISTFHSFCARILRQYAQALGFTDRFSIFDSVDTQRAIRAVMTDLNLDTATWKPDRIADTISLHKSRLELPDDLKDHSSGYYFDIARKVYAAYQRYLKKNNAMDFDDLLVNTVKLMDEHKEVLNELQERFEYILIDEYQDTNRPQYLIAKRLASRHRNICATGDPDQSIYGWRGANLENILNFEKDYPDCRTITLEENYRSTKTILKAASSVVKHNVNRKEKTLYTRSDEGEKIRLIKAHDEIDEAAAIADEIRYLHQEKGKSLKDIAVFFRTNALSRAIETELVKQGISYILVAGVEFYSRKEIKDVLGYLRLALNLKDDVSFKRIVNVPSRKIGPKTVEKIEVWARAHGLSLAEAAFNAREIESIREATAEKIEAFNKVLLDIMDGPSHPVKDIIERVLEKTGYLDYLSKSSNERSEEQTENVMELVNAAGRYDELREDASLQGFLEEVSLITDIDKWDRSAEAVSLMTLHCAKGLEFDSVFIIGFEETLLPHAKMEDEVRDLEEERRLCYVGITRAKKNLYISMCDYRMQFGQTRRQLPSRFFSEIPKELVKIVKESEEEPPVAAPGQQEKQETAHGFSVGDLVHSPYFGLGKVISISGSGRLTRVKVDFNAGGERNLVLGYANLKKAKVPY